MLWLQDHKPAGVHELTPGIRSLQIHYDSLVLTLTALLDLLQRAESALHNMETLDVPARVVHLPLSWDDDACRMAIDKYMQSVRKDAPWCPSNIEFIRRINGLSDIAQVREIVFSARSPLTTIPSAGLRISRLVARCCNIARRCSSLATS